MNEYIYELTKHLPSDEYINNVLNIKYKQMIGRKRKSNRYYEGEVISNERIENCNQ